MKEVPELYPADRKSNEGTIWNYFSKWIDAMAMDDDEEAV